MTSLARNVKWCAVLGVALVGPISSAQASDVMECRFPGLQFFVVTQDDQSSKIGVKPGVGNKGRTYEDPLVKGARVVLEFNMDDMPITMTTIKPDGAAIHSRQMIDVLGEFSPPSQLMGACEAVY